MRDRMTTPPRNPQRRWIVCGLLLLASAINYMDRQTLANAAVRITHEFHLTQQQYGNLEAWFGYAFAAGSLVFGFLADRLPLRRLYAAVLVLWSLVGFATGFTHSFTGLLVCRTFLGFFESGHWPCGVKATRALLDARDRSLGNGVLQSGTSIGAIITPLIMNALLTPAPGSWRPAFILIGAIGVVWVALWFLLVGPRDLTPAPAEMPDPAKSPLPLTRLIFSRRMLVLFFVVASINTMWQILRAWLPKFLQEGRGWTESAALYFNSAWFLATDVGCLGAGALAVWLAHRRFTVTEARLLVFGACGLLCALCAAIPVIGRSWVLGLLLLVIGAGALGLFPIYHAFTQDISGDHQGRITGIASVAAWILPAMAQPIFGWLVDRTGSFNTGLVVAGFLPLAAWVVLHLAWGREPARVGEAA